MARPENFRTIEKELQRLVTPFRVTDGKRFHLDDVNPGDTRGVKSKAQAREYLRHGVEALSDLQEKLYARNQWSVLLVFQAIDAAGKDGAIAHVMSGINPQGCQVYSFKSPSSEELDHDFLWRTTKALPERGRIGIFNRSYYMRAYEDMTRHTAAEHAPWYVVPADNKWFTRLVVAWAIHGAMSRLRLAFHEVDVEKQRELNAVRRALRAQSTGQGSSARASAASADRQGPRRVGGGRLRWRRGLPCLDRQRLATRR